MVNGYHGFCVADPALSSKDGDTRDTETHDDRPCDTEGNRVEGGTNIMGITIHGTDCLVPDVRLTHPLIQLHIIDMETGRYMKKSDKYKNNL